MSEPLKVRSYRVGDETAEKFKRITEELGCANQDETFARLIHAYEMQKGKELLPEKTEDINRFEAYADMLTKLYITSLQESTYAKELAVSEVEQQIKDRDEIIVKLQKELSNAGDIAAAAEKNLISLREQVKVFSDNIKEQKEILLTTEEERDRLRDKVHALEKEISKINDEKYIHQKDALSYKSEADTLKKSLSDIQDQLWSSNAALKEKERTIAEYEATSQKTEERLKEVYEKGRLDGIAEEKQAFLTQSEQYFKDLRATEEKYLSAMEKLEELHKRYITLLEQKQA